jgi:cupin superfamily acireductone dioxygenase involved in methionine salvage
MKDYPKSIKKLIRQFMTEAYERELHRELTKLEVSFEQWRSNEISSGEFSYRIHQYEIGPSKELYKKYNYGEADMNVAYAIATEILNRDEVPAELLESLAGPLSFFESLDARGQLRKPD